MGWKLININDPNEIRQLSVFPFTVGRCPTANLVLRSKTISKQHAIVHKINGQLYIKDTSMNGTYLNNHKIDKGRQVEMKHCDMICFGNDTISPNGAVSIDIINAYKLEDIEVVVNLSKLKMPSDNDAVDATQPVLPEPSTSSLNPVASTSTLPIPDPHPANSTCTGAPIKAEATIDCCTIKQEVFNDIIANKPGEPIYKIDERIIDITEDDNEFDDICSQMYTRKDDDCEQQQIDFVRIKQELQYLDEWGDVYEEAGIVDLDYETNSNELLSILEGSPRKATNSACAEVRREPQVECAGDVGQFMTNIDAEPQPGCSIDNIVQPLKASEQISPPADDSHKAGCSKHHDEFTRPELNTNGQLSEGVNVSNDPQPGCSKNLDEIRQAIQAKASTHKSMVIDALPLRKGKKLATKKRPFMHIDAKRKDSIESANKENAKKSRTEEIRKQAANVKISDNRGKFLTEFQPSKPPIRRGKMKKNPVVEIGDCDKESDLNIDIPIADESAADTLFNSLKPNHKADEKAAPPKQVIENQLVPAKSHPTNTVSEWMHSPAPHRVAMPATMPQHYNKPHKPAYMTHKKFVNLILHWSLAYFDKMAQTDLIRLWPKIGGEVLIRLANTFVTGDHYIKKMNTLVLIEIFSECYKEYRLTPYSSVDKNAISVGCVESVHTDEHFTKLVCFVYLEEKTVESGNLIKQNNFSNFTVTCRERTRRTNTNFFGIVTSPSCRKIKDTEFVDKRLVKSLQFPLYKHSFTIIAKAHLEVPVKSTIYLRNFCSLNRYFAKLDAICRVQDYIYQFILTPKYEHFKLPTNAPFQFFEHKCLTPMNEEQKAIVQNAVNFCSPDVKSPFMLIQGPPGTGKTFVIINILLSLLKMGEHSCILLLAQSNAALNHLINLIHPIRKELELLNAKFIKMVRVGSMSQSDSIASRYHVDEFVRTNLLRDLYHQNPTLEADYQKIIDEIGKLKRKKERSIKDEQRLKILNGRYNNFLQYHLLMRYKTEEYEKRKSVILKANVICSTLGSCYSLRSLNINLKFTCCILDEATQASEVESLMPLLFGVKKFIFVGDPKQLPPFNCLLPREYEFHRSFIDRMRINLETEDESPFHMLRTQYRMVPAISSFPNRMFYRGELRDHFKCVQRSDLKHLAPYVVFQQEDSHREKMYENKYEIETIFKILNILNSITLTNPLSIGIITPYNDQKSEIVNQLHGLHHNEHIHIQCHTIDSFQGQEQDIILLSYVRNVANNFVSDANRLNVALTRAKSALYIVASQSLYKSCVLMKALKEDAIDRNVFFQLGQYSHLETYIYTRH